jgi:hypothetical protein
MSQNTILTTDGYLVTIDIVLAAALRSKGYTILSCEEINLGTHIYTFKKTQGLVNQVLLFDKRRMKVKPYWFYKALESIHDEFHSGGRDDN